MGNLAAWLLALVAPFVKRALVALGIGWLTYQGLGAAMAAVQSSVIAAWGQATGDMLRMLSLVGLTEAVGIILGAIAARVSLSVVSRLGKVTA